MNPRDRQIAQLAAIYIRTSSEHQAEKASPEEQEADCRRMAEKHGLTVVDIYRDIERYRAGRRLVDPSGTRADRPALVGMLKDAVAGKFGTLLAWREDRLYRGMRAMLPVLETIQENNLQVLLARETFDPKLTPLKAWGAQMELEGMRERMTMGVKIQTRCGEAFEIPVPPILDMETARKVKEMRQANKTHPGHNLKWDYLLGGMI